MDQELVEYFFEEASRTFGFLVGEYSFEPPQLEVDDKINFAYVTYLGRNLAVECILDEREADVDCQVARIVAGKKTPYHAVDDKGERVREGVFNLLRRRGIEGPLLTKLTGLDLRARIKIALNDFARLLKDYGQDVLNDSPTALTETSPLRR